MCGAGVSAGYFSLVLAEEPAAEQSLEPGTRAYFARQASHFAWGMAAGSVLYAVAHVIGFCWLKGGLANLRAEADPEDLLSGLWIHLGAAVIGALIGGVIGWAAGSL